MQAAQKAQLAEMIMGIIECVATDRKPLPTQAKGGKPFTAIHAAMREVGETQQQLAWAMGCGKSHISECLTSKKPFTTDEAYFLLDRYGIPHESFTDIFRPPTNARTKGKRPPLSRGTSATGT